VRKYLAFVVIALFVSVPAFADTHVTVKSNGDVIVQQSDGGAAAGAASGAAISISMNTPFDKDGNTTSTEIWNQKDGDQVRSVNTRRVSVTAVASVFVNEDGCPLLFAAKYPFLPCN